jgi:endonuclease
MRLARRDDLAAPRAAVALDRRGAGDRTHVEHPVGLDHFAGMSGAERACSPYMLLRSAGHRPSLANQPSYSQRGDRLSSVRLVIARCQVDYAGRLTAHLPMANRLILIKADGSVSIHADDRAYKPLNWMSPPCTFTERLPPDPNPDGEPLTALWEVKGRDGDTLHISIAEVTLDASHDLGDDPGLQKDGVEAHLQALLAEHPEALSPGLSLVRREYLTPIGPVDLLCREPTGAYVAVEVKRRGEIDGVEQLSRYLELMRRDPLLGQVSGIFAAQQIKPQARLLATDRGITCITVDYDTLRGLDNADERLF